MMMMETTLFLGDCLERLRELPDSSVHACVTDPPYGLSFMGKRWDVDVPGVEVWREVLRVLKPGGHLLAFFGTRTYHRGVVAIEDAGFEIRDQIGWAFGSGFPKSLDVGKAIDAALGAEREVVGSKLGTRGADGTGAETQMPGKATGISQVKCQIPITAPATPEAQQWQGWGTGLKPAWEPIAVARKPLDGTVAANVLEHGTGALNVYGCRVSGSGYSSGGKNKSVAFGSSLDKQERCDGRLGRWPANLIHDGSDEVVALAGEQARFFYCAKTSKRDRGDGNNHPTVKPTELMRYLCRLVTQPAGVVLDPFMGSGSTGKAAVAEGFRFIGIEREAEYLEIARRRIVEPDPEAAA